MTAQLINGKETALALREALAAELAKRGIGRIWRLYWPATMKPV